MSLWHETLQVDGQTVDPDVTDAIIEGGAILTSTMEGAESLELTVSDPDMRFLRSGALTRKGKPSTRQQELRQAAWQRFAAMRLSLDGVWFRLAGASGSYDAQPWSITLTFEAEAATLMRNKTEYVKTSRGAVSRAEFIDRLGSWSRIHDISDRGLSTFGIYSPDPFHKDAVAKIKQDDRKKGLSKSAHLTIRGMDIRAEQRRNLVISLTEAENANATDLVYLSMLVAGIGESGFQVIPNSKGSDYGGVFQGKFKGSDPQFKIGDTKGMAHSFLHGGKGFQGGGAIALARAHPDWTPGKIALTVEGSRSNFQSDAAGEAFYQQNINEAKAILDAWGGASKTYTTRESYEFQAGAKDSTTGRRENYWDASGRLADERRWRRFALRNGLWVGPDEWFFKNQPTFVIDGTERFSDQGILGMTFDVDVGMPVSEIQLRAVAPRWTAGAGTVFQFDAPTMPIDGRWLIWSNRLDLTQNVEIADIVLRRPEPQKKEAAPKTRTRTEDAPEIGSARDRIVATAKKALEKVSHYKYEQTRPMPLGLFAFPKETYRDVDGFTATRDGILYIDCSAFATLVYRHAGVKDPNGRDYANATYGDRAHYSRGPEGNTQTLMAGGRRTSNPQPGDMVFYKSPEHVGIYIGDGKVIEMGGTPGPQKLDVTYRSDRIGYFTFDLSDA